MLSLCRTHGLVQTNDLKCASQFYATQISIQPTLRMLRFSNTEKCGSGIMELYENVYDMQEEIYFVQKHILSRERMPQCKGGLMDNYMVFVIETNNTILHCTSFVKLHQFLFICSTVLCTAEYIVISIFICIAAP